MPKFQVIRIMSVSSVIEVEAADEIAACESEEARNFDLADAEVDDGSITIYILDDDGEMREPSA